MNRNIKVALEGYLKDYDWEYCSYSTSIVTGFVSEDIYFPVRIQFNDTISSFETTVLIDDSLSLMNCNYLHNTINYLNSQTPLAKIVLEGAKVTVSIDVINQNFEFNNFEIVVGALSHNAQLIKDALVNSLLKETLIEQPMLN